MAASVRPWCGLSDDGDTKWLRWYRHSATEVHAKSDDGGGSGDVGEGGGDVEAMPPQRYTPDMTQHEDSDGGGDIVATTPWRCTAHDAAVVAAETR
jgi:hypothetical protein